MLATRANPGVDVAVGVKVNATVTADVGTNVGVQLGPGVFIGTEASMQSQWQHPAARPKYSGVSSHKPPRDLPLVR